MGIDLEGRPRLGVGLLHSAAAWLAVFAASLAIFCRLVDPAPSPLDVGFNANSALRVARGEVPYRDFFSLLTPLSFWLNACVIHLFGPSLHAINVVASLIAAIAYATLYAIARQFMSAGWAVAAWAGAMVYSPAMEGVATAYSQTAVTFALVAMLLVIRGLRGEKPSTMLAAGVAIGLAFWTKQTIGAYLLTALATFFALSIRRRSTPGQALRVALGFVALSLLPLGYLLSRGAIGPLWRDCVVQPFDWWRSSTQARLPRPSLSDLGWDVEGAEPLLYFVAFGATLLTLLHLAIRARRHAIDPAFGAFALASGGLLFITRERYGLHNLLCVSPPIFVLLVRPLHRAWAGPRGTRWTAVAGGLALAVFLGLGVRYAIYQRTRFNVADHDARGAFARQVFRDHAGARIVVLPCAPLYYFEAGASNPTRFDIVIPGNLSPADIDEFIRDLWSRVDYVLFDEYWAVDRVHFSEYHPAIYAALLRDFKPIANGPQGQVFYERRR